MIIVSLCDKTGIMVEPWVEEGYSAILVDPQHPRGISVEGPITKIGGTILEATPFIQGKLKEIVFVAGFPPCTDVAVSGARWFSSKLDKDPYCQVKAALVAEQCRMIGLMAGCPWLFENPVSIFSSIFGRPNYTFHPWEYSGWCQDDNYTKKTCLWSGGWIYNARTVCGRRRRLS